MSDYPKDRDAIWLHWKLTTGREDIDRDTSVELMRRLREGERLSGECRRASMLYASRWMVHDAEPPPVDELMARAVNSADILRTKRIEAEMAVERAGVTPSFAAFLEVAEEVQEFLDGMGLDRDANELRDRFRAARAAFVGRPS